MPYIENLSCGVQECHFNHDNFCHREVITLDIGGTCEDQETCENYECQDCEFFDFCTKDKKFSSSAFSEDGFFED